MKFYTAVMWNMNKFCRRLDSRAAEDCTFSFLVRARDKHHAAQIASREMLHYPPDSRPVVYEIIENKNDDA